MALGDAHSGDPHPGDLHSGDLPSSDLQCAVHAANARHWRRVVVLTVVLLAIWAAVSLGCGVLFADWLNRFRLAGFPLGFWFAQQGAIVVFVLLVLVYALGMARLERRHRAHLQQLRDARATPARAAEGGR